MMIMFLPAIDNDANRSGDHLLRDRSGSSDDGLFHDDDEEEDGVGGDDDDGGGGDDDKTRNTSVLMLTAFVDKNMKSMKC